MIVRERKENKEKWLREKNKKEKEKHIEWKEEGGKQTIMREIKEE